MTGAPAQPNSITTIAALRYSDLIATGSCDGNIKLWKIQESTITHVRDFPVCGWVNSLKFSATGKYLVAGVGQEPALGRWVRLPDAKNGLLVIQLDCLFLQENSINK